MSLNPKDYRMPKEKALSWHDFHGLMNQRIRELHPGRTALKAVEIARMENHDPRTVRKKYRFDAYGSIPVDDYIRECYRRSRNQ